MATVPFNPVEYDRVSADGPIGTFKNTASWTITLPSGEEKKESKTDTFKGPAEPTAIEAYLKGLDAVGRTKFFGDWYYGANLKHKATLRPKTAVDSPWVARDDISINLATGERLNKKTGVKLPNLPLERVINAINNGMGNAADLGIEPQNALVVAKRMHLEAKTAAEKDGKLVPVRK